MRHIQDGKVPPAPTGWLKGRPGTGTSAKPLQQQHLAWPGLRRRSGP